MYISVVIIAYDRRQFLLDAFQSVINQSLSREKFEIIIIKNYKDNVIDEFISKYEVKTLISNNKNLSGKIYEALEVASGEIVSFLEDDDRFFQNKLEVVLENFKRNTNLVYYHNSSIFEDNERKQLPFKFDSPSFNLSSISIKKNIIYKEALKTINSHVDTFLYFNSIDCGGFIKVDNLNLTYYRYHGELEFYTVNFISYLEHKLYNLMANVNTYELIVSNLKTEKGIKNLHNKLITTKINANIICALVKNDFKYKISLRELLFWLKYPVYENRNFPLLFKLIKYCEMLMPKSFKSMIEKIDFEKRKKILSFSSSYTNNL